MMKDYQKRILELLEQLELELARLYHLFAEIYPSRKTLWLTMAQEEEGHAAKLKKFHSMTEAGEIMFDEKMTKTYTVKVFLDNIQNLYKEAERRKVPLLKALALSHDFEQSIIEKRFYDYFLSNDDKVKMIIESIKKDLLDHISRIKKAIDEERKLK